jgi:hypothetical protein
MQVLDLSNTNFTKVLDNFRQQFCIDDSLDLLLVTCSDV